MGLLGDEDASAGWIDNLGINITNLVASRGAAESTIGSRSHDQSIRSRDGTRDAAFLDGLDGRLSSHALSEGGHDRRSEVLSELDRALHRGSGEDVAARLLADLEQNRPATSRVNETAPVYFDKGDEDLLGVVLRTARGNARSHAQVAELLGDGREASQVSDGEIQPSILLEANLPDTRRRIIQARSRQTSTS